MSGNSIKFASICLVLATLSSCGGAEVEAPAPASRPVKIFVVGGGVADAIRSFPGRVDATQRADLAFRIPGQIREIKVAEGDLVEEGQVLALLDPTDYKVVLEDRQASFDNATSNYERAKELIKDGNISRVDFDRMEADFRTASAALSQAKNDLQYSVLHAPFRGRIAERRVENFEEVLAKQTVFSLQNIKVLDVIINVPESIIRSVGRNVSDTQSIGENAESSAVTATAQFEGRSEYQIPLRLKELATKADEQTQTFRTTFTMDAPTEFNVLPGMTATVVLDLSAVASRGAVKWVPVRAVQADSGLEPRVWILDSESMTVTGREVTIGRLSGSSVEIKSGLQGGDEIVAVGAPYLAEGMRVTRMKITEQAIPTDDPS